MRLDRILIAPFHVLALAFLLFSGPSRAVQVDCRQLSGAVISTDTVLTLRENCSLTAPVRVLAGSATIEGLTGNEAITGSPLTDIVFVTNGARATVRNLALRGGRNAVYVAGSRTSLTMSNVSVTGQRIYAVYVTGSRSGDPNTVDISNSYLGFTTYGCYASNKGHYLLLSYTYMEHCGGKAVTLWDDSWGLLNEVHIHDNESAGLYLGRRSSVLFTHSSIVEARVAGIFAAPGSYVAMNDVTVRSTGMGDLTMFDPGAEAPLPFNSFADGVACVSCELSLENTVLAMNGRTGLNMLSTFGPSILDTSGPHYSKVYGNQHGIVLHGGTIFENPVPYLSSYGNDISNFIGNGTLAVPNEPTDLFPAPGQP